MLLREREGEVLLDARPLQLAVHAEGEDVVADDVFAAVVLVVAAGLGVVDEVVLHHDAGAALVVVQPPAAVIVGIDVVDDVVADGGAGRGAEGVDAAHVAQHAPAEVMDVVELDLVVVGRAGRVAPSPADGNARVAEIGDVVVRDLVVGAVADPHAHRAAVEVAAGADDVVVDDAMPGGVGAGGVFVVPALARCGRRRRPCRG